MTKAVKNYILVLLLALGALVEVVSGFVLWLALPHGGGGGRWAAASPEFWSISRATWVDMHDWAAVALMAAAALHIFMHWKWIVRMTAQVMRALRQPQAKPVPVAVKQQR